MDRATIALAGGSYFDFETADCARVTITDIARGLSHACRFAGQCPRFYSVAEHSVHVSRIVPPAYAWDALMHDAAEAFLGDVAKPLKNLLPDYRAIEARVERALAIRFVMRHPMPSAIKLADRAMLALEQREVMHSTDPWGYLDGVLPPEGVTIYHFGPDAAQSMFLGRVKELRPDLLGPEQ